MSRLEKMREYRSHLVNEVNALVDAYIANPAGTDVAALNLRVRTMQERVRLMNVEIDKLMAIELGRKGAQPHVQYQLAHA
jgi:hypothetical protein